MLMFGLHWPCQCRAGPEHWQGQWHPIGGLPNLAGWAALADGRCEWPADRATGLGGLTRAELVRIAGHGGHARRC